MWWPTWQEWTIIGVLIGVLLVAWIAIACRFLPCCCVYRLLDRRRKFKEYGSPKWSVNLQKHEIAKDEIILTKLNTESAPLRSSLKDYGTEGKSVRRMISPDRSSTHSTDSWGSVPDDDTPSLPGGEPSRGQLELSLRKNTFSQKVVLTIHRARNLWAFTGYGGIHETFCIVHLLHHKETDTKLKHIDRERHVVFEGRTAARKRSKHPEFNEDFTLPMDLADIKSRILVVTVWAYDKHDNLDPIGEIALDFEDIDLTEGETLLKYLEEAHQEKKGELCLSLCYRPTAEKLTLVPLEATGLVLPPGNECEICARVMIMERGKVRIRKKTKIQKASENMKFSDEPLVLDIPQERLPTIVLLIHLVQFPTGQTEDRPVQVGKVVIGPKLGETANQHWLNMISNPREPVIHTHVLT